MPACRQCGRAIEFARRDGGRGGWIPIDPGRVPIRASDRDARARVEVYLLDGRHIRAQRADKDAAQAFAFVPHHRTCPEKRK